MSHLDAIAREMLGATRVPARAAAPYGYTGGFGGAKWAGGLSNSGNPLAVNHATAMQNARVAMHQSVQARAIVERTADTIADGGLRLELSPVIGVLGITRQAGAEWAREVAARFDLWAKDKRAHRAEQINFYQSHGQWQLYRHRDNDQFVRLTYDNDPNLQNPLQFEFLDPSQIRGSAFTWSWGFQPGGDGDGIKRDDRSRETAYKVWVRQKDGTYTDVDLPATYPGGRRAMLHGFSGEYAGQGRGYSRLAHAIQEFENITDFSAATIKKAINQSNIVAFVKPSKDEDAVNVLEEIAGQAAGPAAQYLGSNPQPVDGLPAPGPAVGPGLDSYYSVPEATVHPPGSLFIGNLPKGSDISFPQNSAPGDSFDKFVDAFASHIAASMKIPLEVVLMKFGQNYSASRATLLLFWRVCLIERQEMAADYLNPVLEMWLAGEIAAGRVIAPGWSDPRMRAAWLNCRWIGSSSPDIDPAKSAKAARENIEIGRTNAECEAQDFNGTSAADNIAKNNDTYQEYEPLPWNEVGNPPPGTAAPAPAAGGKAMAALLDEMRMMIREELENAD